MIDLNFDRRTKRRARYSRAFFFNASGCSLRSTPLANTEPTTPAWSSSRTPSFRCGRKRRWSKLQCATSCSGAGNEGSRRLTRKSCGFSIVPTVGASQVSQTPAARSSWFSVQRVLRQQCVASFGYWGFLFIPVSASLRYREILCFSACDRFNISIASFSDLGSPVRHWNTISF